METSRYFIKKFKTSEKYYIYDVNSNVIFRVDERTYQLIDASGKTAAASSDRILNSTESKKSVPSRRKELKQPQYQEMPFSSKRPHRIVVPELSEIKKTLETSLLNLTLIVTENCNLRCKYCLYSGHYFYERKHSANSMSSSIAIKSIDFYLEHSRNSEEISIGFYGGEPLLKFRLLKECVQYLNRKNINLGKSIFIHLSTNGTLLNREILDFLSENNIGLQISIDGPRDVHDRYCVTKNGKGTYDTVLKSINFIKDHYPDYFNDLVAYNTVLCPPYDLANYRKYIDSHDDIYHKGKFPRVNFVIPFSNDLFTNGVFPLMNKAKTIASMRKKMLDEYSNELLQQKDKFTFIKYFFYRDFEKIWKRGYYSEIDDSFDFKSVCIPGHRNTYITPKGSIHMCANLTSMMSIGNINGGFNFPRVEQIMHEFLSLNEDNCRDCWAIRFCNICYAHVVKDEGFDLEYKKILCKYFRAELKQLFIAYMAIYEKNSEAFRLYFN